MASNSSSSQPTPMPSSTRPPERRSRVAISLATMIGLRTGSTRMPVASRIVVVAAATNASQMSGSGMSLSSGPRHLAGGAAGYVDS